MLTIGNQMIETIRAHEDIGKGEAWSQSVDWIARVGLPDSERIMRMYPHELSGGMVQRAMIAIALSCQPKLLIADEPVDSLDVSIQAQIINLFRDLQERRSTSFLFISHDLSVVEHLCTRIIIMYLGVVVESGDRQELFANPIHLYTKELLAAIPVPDLRGWHSVGTVPPGDPAARCPYAQAICDGLVPKLHQVNERHWVSWPQEE